MTPQNYLHGMSSKAILRACLLVFCVFSFVSQAAAKDSWQALSEQASLLSQSEEQVSHQAIPLGKIHKIEGRWKLQKSERFDGVLHKRLLQFDTALGLKAIAKAYTAFLQDSEVSLIFNCESRSCGSSNFWSNYYFYERRLYAPENQQYLWVYQQDGYWFVTYLVQRGNGRIYFQEFKMGIQGSLANTLSLGEFCILRKGQAKYKAVEQFLQTSDRLLAKHENAGVEQLAVVLTVSANTANAWQDSQSFAADCGARLQQLFGLSLYESLGLGAVDSSFSQRVGRTEYRLHRFTP